MYKFSFLMSFVFIIATAAGCVETDSNGAEKREIFDESLAPDIECFREKQVEVYFPDQNIKKEDIGVVFFTPWNGDNKNGVFWQRYAEYYPKYNKEVTLHFYMEQKSYAVVHFSESAHFDQEGGLNSKGQSTGLSQWIFELPQGESKVTLTWENPFCDGYLLE